MVKKRVTSRLHSQIMSTNFYYKFSIWATLLYMLGGSTALRKTWPIHTNGKWYIFMPCSCDSISKKITWISEQRSIKTTFITLYNTKRPCVVYTVLKELCHVFSGIYAKTLTFMVSLYQQIPVENSLLSCQSCLFHFDLQMLTKVFKT